MEPQAFDEQAILKASIDRDTEAFGMLVRKYQSYICSLAYSAIGSIEKSEDVAQNVFVSVWKNLSQLRDIGKFKSWMSQITRNEIVKYYQQNQRDVISKSLPLNTTIAAKSSQAGPVEQAISKETEEFVFQALGRIPQQYREPLILFYWHGKSVRQVAEFFELSEEAAKKRISRAREMLRGNVENIVEQTIAATSPAEKFSASVLAIIGVKGAFTVSSAAAAGSAHAAGAAKAAGIGAGVTGITVKIAAIVAIAAAGLGTGALLLNNRNNAPAIPPSEIVHTLPEGLQAGLVMYFSFDSLSQNAGQNVIPDESGNGNDGFLTGSKLSKGKFGQALKCDAKSKTDGAIVKDADSLDLDDVTITAWIKTGTLDGQWGRILDKSWKSAYNLCIGGDYQGKQYRDKLVFECTGISAISNIPVVDGKWHFVASSYDGQTIKIYIDGKLDTLWKNQKYVPMEYNNTDIHIGRLAVLEPPPYAEANYDGLIDELRLYNRVLSDDEIQTLFNYQPAN